MKGDLFHLLNRGVEKRKIFLDESDYLRFIHNLHDFNDSANVLQSYWRRRKMTEVRPPSKEVVDVLGWSLLSNHPHLLVMEKIDGGKSLFSQKIFGGYTMYFNERYERGGVLFQGRTKIIPVTTDQHFYHLPFYIHLNPLDLFDKEWRTTGVKDVKKSIEFLDNYRWSNYRDISGRGEFPSTTNRGLFFEIFNTNEKRYRKDLIEWLANYKGNLTEVRPPSNR